MRPKASDPAAAEVLAACDRVRDVSLPPLGVRLEDLSGGGSRWKLDDPQVKIVGLEFGCTARLDDSRRLRY